MTVQEFASRALYRAANTPIQGAPKKSADGGGSMAAMLAIVVVVVGIAVVVWISKNG